MLLFCTPAMAAVSVTVTATKIDVTSTGGVQVPFSDVVAAANAITPGTITIDGQIYTITTTTYRELEISANCKVLFETGDVIRWQWGTTTTSTYIFDIVDGGEIEVEPGVTFDFEYGTPATGDAYASWFGYGYLHGTEANPIILKNAQRIYIYGYDSRGQNWEWFEVIDNPNASGYGMYITGSATQKFYNISLKNFKSYNTSGNNGYGMYLSGGYQQNVTIEDFEIDGKNIGIFGIASTFKVKNGTIKNCSSYGANIQNVGNNVSPGYETSKDDTKFPAGRFQPSATFENVTFQDNAAGSYNLLAYYNSNVRLINCNFIGVNYSTGPMISGYNSTIIEEGTTFTNISTPRTWSNEGTFLHAKTLDITVVDINGSPIEDATVSIIQGSTPAKENWARNTDANGKVLTLHGYTMALIEKEETAAGVYAQWSNDPSTGLVHHITVSKYGYADVQFNLEMTEDKTVTVTLLPTGSTGTTLYDATLYDAVIY